MKLAVLSDIHGNHIALEAVLNDIGKESVDGFVFLGDYVTDFPGGREVCDRIRDLRERFPCILIRGNREDYLLDQRSGKTKPWSPNNTTNGTLYHALKSLTRSDLDFFESLPIADTFQFKGMPRIAACHASPNGSHDSIFYQREKAFDVMENSESDILLCGHQHLVRTDCHGRKRVYFVGSVGLANGYGGCAQYAMLSGNGSTVSLENRIVPYDVHTAVEEFHTRGLLECGRFWARMIRISALTGLSIAPSFAELGYSMLRNADENTDAESVWARAFEELNLTRYEHELFGIS